MVRVARRARVLRRRQAALLRVARLRAARLELAPQERQERQARQAPGVVVDVAADAVLTRMLHRLLLRDQPTARTSAMTSRSIRTSVSPAARAVA